jgi:hypothetical protein
VIDLNKGNGTGKLQVLDAKLAGHPFGCTISARRAAVFFSVIQQPRLIPSASARSYSVNLRRCSIIG